MEITEVKSNRKNNKGQRENGKQTNVPNVRAILAWNETDPGVVHPEVYSWGIMSTGSYLQDSVNKHGTVYVMGSKTLLQHCFIISSKFHEVKIKLYTTTWIIKQNTTILVGVNCVLLVILATKGVLANLGRTMSNLPAVYRIHTYRTIGGWTVRILIEWCVDGWWEIDVCQIGQRTGVLANRYLEHSGFVGRRKYAGKNIRINITYFENVAGESRYSLDSRYTRHFTARPRSAIVSIGSVHYGSHPPSTRTVVPIRIHSLQL